MASFSEKNQPRIKLYMIRRKSNFLNEYAIYIITWREQMYISFMASPLMKYAFFASLDEINDMFIQKI